jgi:hypothetical protein
MKPKDPKWNVYKVTEENSKKITKCRECGRVVSAIILMTITIII